MLLPRVSTVILLSLAMWAGDTIRKIAVAQPAARAGFSVDSRSTARPVALAIPRGKAGYILQSDGQVMSFEIESPANRSRVFELGSNYLVTDLAASELDGGVLLCTTVVRKVGEKYDGWIVQYSSGRKLWSWLPTGGIYGGVAVHHKSKRAYAVNSSTAEIMAVSFERNDARYIGSLESAERPGPLAVDEDGSALIVGDLATGQLYRFDLVTRKSEVLTTTFARGEIRAIARDSKSGVFYVADAARETVWYGPITDRKFITRRPLRTPEFEDPSGVAVDGRGWVWVADAKARRLFVFGSDDLAIKQVVPW